jgi:serine/threonine protein kinase
MLPSNTLLCNRRFRIIRAIGKGGQGYVYEALDGKWNNIVAVKERYGVDSEKLRRAFELEARTLARLIHRSIPRVIEHFFEGGRQFLVMDFIEGLNLSQLLFLRQRPFTCEELMPVADGLLAALEYLHRQEPPIIHRDIKPANIKWAAEDKEVYLLDFGLAKGGLGTPLTGDITSSVFGLTPAYAPPEQLEKAGTNAQSDLYSLGATLYHLLTGHEPVEASVRNKKLYRGELDPLLPAHERNADIPPAISEVIAHAMMLDRIDRITSARKMRRLLHEAWASAKAAQVGVTGSKNIEVGTTVPAVTDRRSPFDPSTLTVNNPPVVAPPPYDPFASEADKAWPSQVDSDGLDSEPQTNSALEPQDDEIPTLQQEKEQELNAAVLEAQRLRAQAAQLEEQARREDQERRERECREQEERDRIAREEVEREEEARLRAQQEARERAAAEERRKAEEGERRKSQEEAARLAEGRKRVEAEAQRRAEEEAARQKAEAEVKLRAEEAEAARRQAEAEAAAHRAAEEEAARLRAEEQARLQVEEEQARVRAAEEERQRAEQERERREQEQREREERERALQAERERIERERRELEEQPDIKDEGTQQVPGKNLPDSLAITRVRRVDVVRKAAGDLVDCSVFAPSRVPEGQLFTIQVFAHLPSQSDVALKLATSFDKESERRAVKSLELAIERESTLTFHLSMPGLKLDEPVKQLVWKGEPSSVHFRLAVPVGLSTASVVGTVIVSQANAPVGHFKFKIEISDSPLTFSSAVAHASVDAHFYKKAFVSYAAQDRPEVLKRVQLLPRLNIKVFQDVLSLEPGALWEKEVYRHIDESDLFLLFWSSAAKHSSQVMKEVNYALSRKGENDFAPPEIVPVIIEGPPPPTPPDELSHLHFNDYRIYVMGVAAPDVPQHGRGKRCPQCHLSYPDNANFCDVDGTRLMDEPPRPIHPLRSLWANVEEMLSKFTGLKASHLLLGFGSLTVAVLILGLLFILISRSLKGADNINGSTAQGNSSSAVVKTLTAVLPGMKWSKTIYQPSEDEIWTIAIAPSGNNLVGAGKDGKVRRWNIGAPNEKPEILDRYHASGIRWLGYTPDNGGLISAGEDSNIQIRYRDNPLTFFKDETDEEARTSHHGAVNSMTLYAYNSNTFIASGSSDGIVKIWKFVNGKGKYLRSVRRDNSKVLALAFPRNGASLAVGYDDGTIHIWSKNGQQEVTNFPAQAGDVTSLAFSCDGGLLAAGGADGTIKVWETTNWTKVTEIKADARVNSISFEPGGRNLASAGDDNKIILWDTETGKPKATLTGHTGPVMCVSFFKSKDKLITGSKDKTIILWSIEDGK